MKKKETFVNKIVIWSIFAVLALYVLTILATLFWGLITSLKSNVDFLYGGNILGFPNPKKSADELKLKNYALILENFKFEKSVRFFSGAREIVHRAKLNFTSLLYNTVLYAGGSCVLISFVPLLMAYMCQKYPCKASKIIYNLNLFVMILPIVGGTPATITLLRQLNLYDNFFGNFVLKFSFTGMYFFVYHAFFQGVSNSYIEAAEVDGASQLNIFIRIILPMAAKIAGTIMLIQFISHWNDYNVPLLYLPTKPTLAYGVFHMVIINSSGPLSKVPIKVAGCMVLALPILLVFIILKDKLMGNISLGGLKE